MVGITGKSTVHELALLAFAFVLAMVTQMLLPRRVRRWKMRPGFLGFCGALSAVGLGIYCAILPADCAGDPLSLVIHFLAFMALTFALFPPFQVLRLARRRAARRR